MKTPHLPLIGQAGENKTETSDNFNGALVAATTTPSSNGQSAQLPPVAGPGWREHLHRLEALGLVLLPIGAGPPDRKFPVNPETGYGLKDWPNLPGFSAAEIAAMDPNYVIGACINTGPSGLDVLDIDGAAAVAWAEARGVNPRDPALFRVGRNTDPDRFKILFRLTPEQRLRFPQVKNLLRVGEPDAEGKRQAIETYAKTGAQVIVLGQHCKSGGWYGWAGDPSTIGPPSEEWLQLLIALAAEVVALRGKGDSSRPPGKAGKGGGAWQASSHRNPCPVCGRDHSGACTRTTAANGRLLVSCYHGGTFSPDTTIKKGDVITGRDGNRWALVETYYAECLGEKSLFIDDQQRQEAERPGQAITANGNSSAPPAASDDDDDLPPGPTPERLAEIEQKIAESEQAEAEERSRHTRASLQKDIAALKGKVKWEDDTETVELWAGNIARLITLNLATEGDQLIPLRDRLCSATGAPKAHISACIKRHMGGFGQWLAQHGGLRRGLIAERDARQLAIQQRQQQHERQSALQIAAEHKQHQLQQAAGMEAVLCAAGDGWIVNEDGGRTESRLTPGALSKSVREALGDRLGFDEMRLLPAVDRQALPPNILQLLYVPLSEQGWIISKEQAVDALSRCAFENLFHPVRLYLQDIEANASIEPIDLEDFYALFHVTDPQQQLYLRLMLLAAVWRAMEPGCSLKLCVIFAGGQTTYKSEALSLLCGPEWLVNTRQQQDKDTLLALYASWFYELGEIDALMDKRHAGDLKNLVSPASDMLRPPFWSAMCRFKRASIFVGTTNRPEFFTDETGNHRYPVVEITEVIDLEGITANRDRIWKAAVALYRKDEKPWLTQEDLRALEARNQEFIQSDPWLPIVQQWTEAGITVTTGHTKDGHEITEHRLAPVEFTTTDALTESGVARQDGLPKAHEMRMATCLRQLGYVKRRCRRPGGLLWLWSRPLTPPGTTGETGAEHLPPPPAPAPDDGGGDPSSPPVPTLSQPQSEQVGTGQTLDGGSDPSSLFQPFQPFSSSGVREGNTHTQEGDLVCVCDSPLGGSGDSLGGTSRNTTEPTAPQGVLAYQPPDRGGNKVGTEGGTEPPEWLPVLQELAERFPDAPSAELIEMLWSGYRIETTPAEVMRWLADWPDPAAPAAEQSLTVAAVTVPVATVGDLSVPTLTARIDEAVRALGLKRADLNRHLKEVGDWLFEHYGHDIDDIWVLGPECAALGSHYQHRPPNARPIVPPA